MINTCRAIFNIAMLCVVGLMLGGGCASATVDQTKRAGVLPKPDMVLVTNFAVTPAEVTLDRGLMATAMRDASDRTLNEEENVVGHLVAEKLAQALVEELRNQGIPAARPGPNVRTSATTAVVTGQFVTVDQGNQSARVWIGFGMGGSQLQTRVQIVQDGQVVAIGETSTKAGIKPGMLVSAGASAAADSGAALAVGAAGTGLSESFLATVQADATRTAKEVAAAIKRAYVARGWMAG